MGQRALGTGVGLSLVAGLIRLPGGHAWVEDRPGGGASSRVRLPLRGAGEPPWHVPVPREPRADAP